MLLYNCSQRLAVSWKWSMAASLGKKIITSPLSKLTEVHFKVSFLTLSFFELNIGMISWQFTLKNREI